MLQYGHLELADKIMDPGYIQHNPYVPQGRDGFKQFMSHVPGRTPQEIKAEWKSAPSLTLANGPYVLMMWDRKDKDPADPAREYTWDHFDVLWIEDGLVKEHWDQVQISQGVLDIAMIPKGWGVEGYRELGPAGTQGPSASLGTTDFIVE